MCHTLINRNEDLKRLADEGFEVEVRGSPLLLLLKNIPHVASDRTVKRGTLISELTLQGDETLKPGVHDVWFSGDRPCDENGIVLEAIFLSSETKGFGGGVVANHRFSRKPPEGYSDYYQKMTTYENIISAPARLIDRSATSRTFAIHEVRDNGSVFKYHDTASSRAGIGAATEKLRKSVVAIVGLGGTGSYILDLVAKTPVREIHLFDGDQFGQHNAFRSPGAPSIEALMAAPMKTEYFKNIYSKMRNRIVTHGYVDDSTVHCLRQMDFVFIAVDKGSVRQLLVENLNEFSVPYIDVGMDVEDVENSLRGTLRVTTSTDQYRDQVQPTLPLVDRDLEDEYSRNIQIAELNALNATLAVIKWKKTLGFYVDLEMERTCLYEIDGNNLINEDQV